MSPTHEEVYKALFALFTTLGPRPSGNGTFKTLSREVKERELWGDGEQPVLMLYELDETINWKAPPASEQEWECWILIGCKTTQGTPGATALNPLIDAVLDAIAPPVRRPFQNLGGIVQSVQATTIIKDVGDNSTGAATRQAGASIRLKITLGVR